MENKWIVKLSLCSGNCAENSSKQRKNVVHHHTHEIENHLPSSNNSSHQKHKENSKKSPQTQTIALTNNRPVFGFLDFSFGSFLCLTVTVLYWGRKILKALERCPWKNENLLQCSLKHRLPLISKFVTSVTTFPLLFEWWLTLELDGSVGGGGGLSNKGKTTK